MLTNVRTTLQAKTLIVFCPGWVQKHFWVYLNKGLFHKKIRPFFLAESWSGLVLIASVHRGIETVSTALPHIRTNLPQSNFIQARLVTADERCGLPRLWHLAASLKCTEAGGEELAESGGCVCSPSPAEEIDSFRGEMSVRYRTDRRAEDHLKNSQNPFWIEKL